MPPLSTAQLTALQSQHTLQSDDFIRICQLAKVEGIFESIESWNFQEFFSFTLHLFITTDSAETREQVSQLLPKFGSRVVLPLVKIAHHFKTLGQAQSDAQASNISRLALQSLSSMAPQTLVIGLREVLKLDNRQALMPIAIAALVNLDRQHDMPMSTLLSELLPKESRQWMIDKLDTERSRSKLQARINNSRTAVKIDTESTMAFSTEQDVVHVVA